MGRLVSLMAIVLFCVKAMNKGVSALNLKNLLTLVLARHASAKLKSPGIFESNDFIKAFILSKALIS